MMTNSDVVAFVLFGGSGDLARESFTHPYT